MYMQIDAASLYDHMQILLNLYDGWVETYCISFKYTIRVMRVNKIIFNSMSK